MSRRAPRPRPRHLRLMFCAELGQSMLVPLLPAAGPTSGSRRPRPARCCRRPRSPRSPPPCRPACSRSGSARCGSRSRPARWSRSPPPCRRSRPEFPTFLAGRLLFGVGFAAIWTAGVTLLVRPGRAALGAVGATVAVGGVAHLVGPPLSGVLSDAVSRALPFWLLASAAATVTLRRRRRARRRPASGSPAPGLGRGGPGRAPRPGAARRHGPDRARRRAHRAGAAARAAAARSRGVLRRARSARCSPPAR